MRVPRIFGGLIGLLIVAAAGAAVVFLGGDKTLRRITVAVFALVAGLFALSEW